MMKSKIPQVVVKRLITYSRILKDSSNVTGEYISSAELGELAGLNSAQVRKDLALFGEFGKPGVGYPVRLLRQELNKILGGNKETPVAIFGIGELGTAITRYLSARKQSDPNYRFVVKVLVDEDPSKTGTELAGVTICSLSEMPKMVQKENIKLGLISVPAYAAQTVVDHAVAAGIRGILNFAPVKVKVPAYVRVQSSDVTMELYELAFYLH